MTQISKQGFIHIHCPKTGGTTVRHMLSEFAMEQGPSHWSAQDMKTHMISIGAFGHWNLAYKFAFVRDPYTWVESMRLHCQRDAGHLLHKASIGNRVDFVKELYAACYNQAGTDNGRIRFQRDMVMFEGVMILDKLCRFENFDQEMILLQRTLGLPARAIEHRNQGPTEPRDISGAYRDTISELFKEDFKYLGYMVDRKAL